MPYTVKKLGGSILSKELFFYNLNKILETTHNNTVFVVSAIKGITDLIIREINSRTVLASPEFFAEYIFDFHLQLLDKAHISKTIKELVLVKMQEEKNSFIAYIQTQRPDMEAFCLSSGERYACLLVSAYIAEYYQQQSKSAIFSSAGLPCLFPEDMSAFINQAILQTKSGTVKKNRILFPDRHCKNIFNLYNIKEAISEKLTIFPILVFPGFYALTECCHEKKNNNNSIKNIYSKDCKNNRHYILFNRGGSDFSAILLSAVLQAPCILYKDTGGLLSGDPLFIKNPKLVKEATYHEALSLAIIPS